MDKLKDFIQDNIEAFEDDILPEGHFERFEQKLPREQKRRFSLFRLSALAAAASIALFILLSMPKDEQDDHMMAFSQEREEMDELQVYYRMQMEDILMQMETLSKQQSEGTADLLQASKQILHDNSIFEKTILPTLPCSGKGVLAMNQHYSASVKGLNIMLCQMKQVINETDNE